MINFHYKKESGQAIIVATIFFVIVSLAIIMGLTGPIFRAQRTVLDLEDSRKSYYLAEAGVEDVAYRLSRGFSYAPTGQVLTLDGHSVTINTTTVSGRKVVTASADWNGAVRKVEASLMAGDGVTFYYGVQIGQGGFILGNNSGINGNVYSNGTITGGNGSYITGDAIAVSTINNVDVGRAASTSSAWAPTVQNITVNGALYCNTGSGNNKPCNTSKGTPTTQGYPIADSEIAEWKADAATSTTVGNVVLSGATNTMGPRKIVGNLTLNGFAKLTVTGTIWVTGNIILGNDAEIALSTGYGSSGGIVIADGTITLGNNAAITGSGTTGSYVMLMSLSNSSTAISLGNGNSVSVILYAPNGTILMGNNASVKAITGRTVQLGNGVVLNYTQGFLDAVFNSGPTGGFQMSSWKETK